MSKRNYFKNEFPVRGMQMENSREILLSRKPLLPQGRLAYVGLGIAISLFAVAIFALVLTNGLRLAHINRLAGAAAILLGSSVPTLFASFAYMLIRRGIRG